MVVKIGYNRRTAADIERDQMRRRLAAAEGSERMRIWMRSVQSALAALEARVAALEALEDR